MDRNRSKRILIFNVNWLGDVLFSTCAIKALRKSCPDVYIACVTNPRTKEILEGNPNLDELILFDEKSRDNSLLHSFEFISRLKAKKFDRVYMFHRSFTRLMLMALANIPQRIGYKAKRRSSLLLTHRVPVCKTKIHRAEHYLNLLKLSGLDCEYEDYEFFVDEQIRLRMLRLLQREGIDSDDTVITINPGANWNLKRWSPDYFVGLANLLIKEARAKIIITGGKKDEELACGIAQKLTAPALVMAGKTSLKELGALFLASKVVVSADSGPLHIAASLSVPVIGLFGPTSSLITGPRGKGKIKIVGNWQDCPVPCYNVGCKDNRCMQSISINKAYEAVVSIL